MKKHVFLLCFLMLFAKAAGAQMLRDTGIYYIHEKKASLNARFIQGLFRLSGQKKARSLKKRMQKSESIELSRKPPRKLRRTAKLRAWSFQGHDCWTIEGQADKPVLLYLHGGAYFFGIKGFYWSFLQRLHKKTGATLIVPDYPLAPSVCGEELLAFVEALYCELLKSYEPEQLVFGGDSAGGGLALALALSLKEQNLPLPRQLLLFSPWLDLSLGNPDIAHYDKKDLMLAWQPLQQAGRIYACSLPLSDYRLSPIQGNLQGLPPIALFAAGREICLPDCRKLQKIAKKQGLRIDYFEYPKLFHCWPIVGHLREARQARTQVQQVLEWGAQARKNKNLQNSF